jgi:urea transport system permease protein
MRLVLLLTIALLVPAIGAAGEVATGDPGLDAAFAQILDRDYGVKAKGIESLAAGGHPNALDLLRGIQDGRLRLHATTGRLVWASEEGGELRLADALTGADLGVEKSRKVKKLPINNQLRGQILGLLAAQGLKDPDPAKRLAAAAELLTSPDPAVAGLLAKRLKDETDPKVRAALETAIAAADLGHQDPARRLAAVQRLTGSLEPGVRGGLARLAESDPDAAVRAGAAAALKKIEREIETYRTLETLFFGLSLGSVLVLAAIGLAITFGVMGVINMAHGELIMLGAYTTFLIQQAIPASPGLSVVLAIPAAFLVSGLAGIAIERGVIRFLYGRPLETLLATFGISLILQQAVRTLISPQNVPVANPTWLSGSWELNSVLSLTYNRLYIFLFCLLVFAALFLVLKRTALGLQVRAVAQNRAMARALGVSSGRVDALTFGLGSGVAGVAGVALSQLTNVGPNLGQAYIVDSFMVVVFGGVGNLWGTLVGGLGLGVANKFLEPWSGAVLAKILVLVFIILFIQKRPRGLFPQKGRAAEG